MTEHVNDLMLTRFLDAPPQRVWDAWTDPRKLEQWFTPPPVTTKVNSLDVHPGGAFGTTMRMADGVEHSSEGIFLEVVEHERLVFTDALLPGYRPSPEPFVTAIITFESEGSGTRYTARVLHKDADDRKKHEEMGFFDGWGTCIDQLSQLVAGVPAQP